MPREIGRRRRWRRPTGLVGAFLAHAVSFQQRAPAPVRSHLSAHAQDIYREAFNHAFAAHADDPRQEEPHPAWAAVKRSYEKVGGSWVGPSARD